MMSRMMMVVAVACAMTAATGGIAQGDEGDAADVKMPEVIDPTGTAPDTSGDPAAANTGADTTSAPAPGSGPGSKSPAGTSATPPAAEDVMKDMLQQEQAPPLIEPTIRPGDGRRSQAPTASVDVDHAVLGVAPGGKQPTLRREGEFIVARRGRLARAADGARMLFVFDADDKQSPEAPLILLPCQMLQSMEEIVQQRGDRVVFILSGQITTYRGANYVMPTMMKLAIDRGNLQ